jgi:hypothetical protein
MPVNTAHPQYEENVNLWSRCRTCIKGEDAVKKRRTEFLPALGSAAMQRRKPHVYEGYLARACFYAAAGRTVAGLVGLILRKKPSIKFGGKEELLKSIGANGESIEQLIRTDLQEVVGVSRIGLLVDAAAGDNVRPHVCVYWAEDIISWKKGVVGGRLQLIRVVLREEREVVGDDEFAYKCETQYRVLRLVLDTEGHPVYGVDLYQKKTEIDSSGTPVETYGQVGETFIPRAFGGAALSEIPFVFHNPSSLDSEPEDPPLLPLVNVNLSHYRNSADLEHGRHFTALPTPWAKCFDSKEDPLELGSTVAWTTDNPDAECGFLEFTGAGLGHIKEGMQHKESLMSALGAQFLEPPRAGVEAAEAIRLRNSGKESVLATIAGTGGEAWTKLLLHLATWMGVKDTADISVSLNTDFDVLKITAQEVSALGIEVQGGRLSWQSYFHYLQKGEVYPENLTADEEAELIAQGQPGGFAGGALPFNPLRPRERPAPEAEPNPEPEKEPVAA